MKLTVTTFLSVDGVVQGPGGPEEDRDGGFDRGGWLVPYADEDLGRQIVTWFAEADAFLLGRRTYQIFAAHWPRVTDPNDSVAAGLNTLPKHVVSRTLSTVEWNNSTLLSGDLAEEVAELKSRPGRELQVHGSPTLVNGLLELGLVDELRLIVFPVVVGAGRRLFPQSGPARALRLVDAKTTGAGAAIHVYQPAGALTFGSFMFEDE